MQLDRDSFIMDAFVGERKHGMVKELSAAVKNTVAFEKSVLTRLLAHQVDKMASPDFLLGGLVAPSPCPELADCQGCDSGFISTNMRWEGMLIGRGDCVWVGETVHLVEACVSIDDELGLLTYPCVCGLQVA